MQLDPEWPSKAQSSPAALPYRSDFPNRGCLLICAPPTFCGFVAYADAMQLTPQLSCSNGLCPFTAAFLEIPVGSPEALLLAGSLIAKERIAECCASLRVAVKPPLRLHPA